MSSSVTLSRCQSAGIHHHFLSFQKLPNTIKTWDMSTINVVKYYFHKANIPATEARTRQLIALAYQTARDKELYPQAVFVRYVTPPRVPFAYRGKAHEPLKRTNRSEVHLTTTINGRRQKDP